MLSHRLGGTKHSVIERRTDKPETRLYGSRCSRSQREQAHQALTLPLHGKLLEIGEQSVTFHSGPFSLLWWPCIGCCVSDGITRTAVLRYCHVAWAARGSMGLLRYRLHCPLFVVCCLTTVRSWGFHRERAEQENLRIVLLQEVWSVHEQKCRHSVDWHQPFKT